MKTSTKLTTFIFMMLFSLNAVAVTVSFHYENFSIRKYAGINETIKKDSTLLDGRPSIYKEIKVFATGEGKKKCATTAKIKALKSASLYGATVEIISYLQDIAETKIENGVKAGSYSEAFTVINKGYMLPSQPYTVTWKLNFDGSAVITISDEVY